MNVTCVTEANYEKNSIVVAFSSLEISEMIVYWS